MPTPSDTTTSESRLPLEYLSCERCIQCLRPCCCCCCCSSSCCWRSSFCDHDVADPVATLMIQADNDVGFDVVFKGCGYVRRGVSSDVRRRRRVEQVKLLGDSKRVFRRCTNVVWGLSNSVPHLLLASQKTRTHLHAQLRPSPAHHQSQAQPSNDSAKYSRITASLGKAEDEVLRSRHAMLPPLPEACRNRHAERSLLLHWQLARLSDVL